MEELKTQWHPAFCSAMELVLEDDSVTITMIRDAKPEKLLLDLAKEGYTVKNTYKGIYYIGRKTNFATQLIVSKELSGRQYVWLKALTRKLDQEKARLLVEQAKRRRRQRSWQLVDSVLAAIIEANKEMFGKLKEDAKMCEALRELMEEELNESKILGERIGVERGERIGLERGERIGLERGERIGLERGEKKGLKALVEVLKGMHLDFESAYQSIVQTEAYTNVSKKEVMEYWQH